MATRPAVPGPGRERAGRGPPEWSEWIGQDSNLQPRSYEHLALPLSYRSAERVAGIEPAYSAWKADALPLSYTRTTRPGEAGLQVGERGFEPPTPASQTLCANRAALLPDERTPILHYHRRTGRLRVAGPCSGFADSGSCGRRCAERAWSSVLMSDRGGCHPVQEVEFRFRPAPTACRLCRGWGDCVTGPSTIVRTRFRGCGHVPLGPVCLT